jgi:hypothetical protein
VSADAFIQGGEGGGIGKEGRGEYQYLVVVIVTGMEIRSS